MINILHLIVISPAARAMSHKIAVASITTFVEVEIVGVDPSIVKTVEEIVVEVAGKSDILPTDAESTKTVVVRFRRVLLVVIPFTTLHTFMKFSKLVIIV